MSERALDEVTWTVRYLAPGHKRYEVEHSYIHPIVEVLDMYDRMPMWDTPDGFGVGALVTTYEDKVVIDLPAKSDAQLKVIITGLLT